ncbi:MAG TPA: 50S ribosomal protein L32 [Clostridiales bacterium]|nr:50S ribosomal protein L32 [Clostridiales bacterium]
MANPKRKWSKARTGARRSQWKLTVPELVSCPQCHALKLPHKVCGMCGHYKGKEIVKA